VGWGEVINGGFGLLLDGSIEADERLKSMLYFDVNNGVARRAWAGNEHAITTITKEIMQNRSLTVTPAHPLAPGFNLNDLVF
jgi:urocanate hydratase